MIVNVRWPCSFAPYTLNWLRADEHLCERNRPKEQMRVGIN